MPFARIHEEAAGCAKLAALSDTAHRVWVGGIGYCQHYLTDGRIPLSAVSTFRARGNVRRAVQELCAAQVPGRAPLWALEGDQVIVHDYLDWNDSRAVVEAKREQAKRRKRRQRGQVDVTPPVTPLVTRDVTPSVTPDVPPVVTSEVPPESRQDLSPPRTTYHGTPSADAEGVRRAPLLASHPSHRSHASCCCAGRGMCVPAFLHDEFKGRLGGDPEQADRTLRQWYLEVKADLDQSQAVIAEKPTDFWNQRFRFRFGTARTRTTPAAPGLTGAADPSKYDGLAVKEGA